MKTSLHLKIAALLAYVALCTVLVLEAQRMEAESAGSTVPRSDLSAPQGQQRAS